MTLTQRLIQLGCEEEKAGELYAFYSEKKQLGELEEYVRIQEMLMEVID